MRFQNLRARWRESDLHSRSWAAERRRHRWSNHFWHKTAEQCAAVWLRGYTERSDARPVAQFDLKKSLLFGESDKMCAVCSVAFVDCDKIHACNSLNYLLQEFVCCSQLLASVYERGNHHPGAFGAKSGERCSIFQDGCVKVASSQSYSNLARFCSHFWKLNVSWKQNVLLVKVVLEA